MWWNGSAGEDDWASHRIELLAGQDGSGQDQTDRPRMHGMEEGRSVHAGDATPMAPCLCRALMQPRTQSGRCKGKDKGKGMHSTSKGGVKSAPKRPLQARTAYASMHARPCRQPQAEASLESSNQSSSPFNT